MEPLAPPLENLDSLVAWLAYIKQHESSIYSRAIVDGKWDSISLAQTKPEDWAQHIARWLLEGSTPYRIKEETNFLEPGE